MGLLWRLNKEVHYSKTAHTKEVGGGVVYLEGMLE